MSRESVRKVTVTVGPTATFVESLKELLFAGDELKRLFPYEEEMFTGMQIAAVLEACSIIQKKDNWLEGCAEFLEFRNHIEQYFHPLMGIDSVTLAAAQQQASVMVAAIDKLLTIISDPVQISQIDTRKCWELWKSIEESCRANVGRQTNKAMMPAVPGLH